MKDFCLNSNEVFVSDEKDLIIQQIDVLFDTNYCELLGVPSFGADFHQFIWDLGVSNQEISQYASQLIKANVNLMGWSVSVDTNILEGTKNDIILVTIELKKDFTKVEKTYKIE